MTDPLDQLKQWRETTDAATEGPWWRTMPLSVDDDWDVYSDTYVYAGTGLSTDFHVAGEVKFRDSEFIATSRTAMPALLTAVENVLNEHEPEPYAQGADYCRECCHRWPCATYAAIRDALGGAK